jgi:hypothetical protein
MAVPKGYKMLVRRRILRPSQHHFSTAVGRIEYWSTYVWGKCLDNFHLRSEFRESGNIPYLSRLETAGMISSMSKKIELHDLFPNLSDRELEEIADVLHQYCTIVWRIYERLEQEQPEVIDGLMKNRSMKTKVDSSETN